MILTVRALRKYFPVRAGLLQKQVSVIRAVDGVSFSVKRGEVFGLVGESGSGKTTIGFTLVGIYRPTNGEIEFEGQSIAGNRYPPWVSGKLQIVFQDPVSSLNPRRTIAQTLDVPLKVHTLVRQRRLRLVREGELLEMVDMPRSYLHKLPGALSGGQMQRIAIARALAVKPLMIVLDEPTASLDVSVQSKVISLLNDVRTDFGLSYLFITHDLALISTIAHRVAVMYLGRICESAPAVQLFENPLHYYTKMLLASIPTVFPADDVLKPKGVESKGEIASPMSIPTGCSFHPRCPVANELCSTVQPVAVEPEEGHRVWCHEYLERSTCSLQREVRYVV